MKGEVGLVVRSRRWIYVWRKSMKGGWELRGIGKGQKKSEMGGKEKEGLERGG